MNFDKAYKLNCIRLCVRITNRHDHDEAIRNSYSKTRTFICVYLVYIEKLLYNISIAILTTLTCSLNKRHEVPNFNEIGLLFNLVILVDLPVFAHAEEQFMPIVDNLLDVERLVMHHEGIARVMNHHVLG